MNFKKSFFSVLLFTLVFQNTSTLIFAEPTTNFATNQTGENLRKAAQEQCTKILEGKGIESTFQGVDVNSLQENLPPITLGSGAGGSTVPVIDQSLISIAKGIFQAGQKENELTNKAWAELRRLNLGLFCVQATKMADAVEAVKKNAAKIAEADFTYSLKDPNKILEQINKEVCLEVVNNREKLGLDENEAKAAVEYCKNLNSTIPTLPKKDVKISDEIAKSGNGGAYGLIMARQNSRENVYRDVREKIDVRIASKKATVMNDYDKYGVVGLYLCTKTYSGNDPSKVKWWESDCTSWKNEIPASLVLEQNKKLINLPLDLALSPAAVLGEDKEVTNITNRIYSGVAGEAPWEQQGIYSNFAQSNGGNPYFPNVNQGGGGNNLGITNGVGTGGGSSIGEIKDANKVKDELLRNITLTLAMYNLGKTYYASTTSPCAVLPIAKRVETIKKIDEAMAPIQKRKDDIEKRWAEVLANPTADHSKFFLQLSADLGQNFNKEFVQKVYDAVAALLKVCVDAKNGASASTNTNTNTITVTTNGL
jgi:hypothetical protein